MEQEQDRRSSWGKDRAGADGESSLQSCPDGAHRAQKVDTGLHDWNVREDRVQKERENVASEAAQWRRGLTMHRREQGSSSKVSALTAP